MEELLYFRSGCADTVNMTTTQTPTARLVNIYLAHAIANRFGDVDIVRGGGAYGVLAQALEAAARTIGCVGLIITDVVTGETYAAVTA